MNTANAAHAPLIPPDTDVTNVLNNYIVRTDLLLATTTTSSTLIATTASVDNLYATTASVGTLIATSVVTDETVSNLIASAITTANLVVTASSTIPSLVTTNLQTTDITSANLLTTASTSQSIVAASGTVTTLHSTISTITNLQITAATASNLLTTASATTPNLVVTTAATTTNLVVTDEVISNNLSVTSSTISDMIITASTIQGLLATVATIGQLSLLSPAPSLSSSFAFPPTGRLTLTSGVPVTTSDVTAATTICYCPYKGNTLSLYDGTKWGLYNYSQLSLSLSGFTASICYDIFVYDNSGTLTLAAVAWTNATTRATALSVVDGMNVLSSDNTRLYLGTIYMTATGQTQDATTSPNGRYVWNMYNRVSRAMNVFTSIEWTYAGGTRQANADTAHQLNCVVGLIEDCVHAAVGTGVQNQTAGYNAGIVMIGMNSTTTQAGMSSRFYPPLQYVTSVGQNAYTWVYVAIDLPCSTVGKNFIAWLEQSQTDGVNFGATGFGGNGNSGMTGSLLM